MPGLLSCDNFQQYYCIVKLIEVLISGLLTCFCLVQIVIRIKMQGRRAISIPLVILILILLSLIFNFAHSLIAQQNMKILFYLQLYFANNFFLTIFYYVGDNVLKGRIARIALHIFYIALILFYTAILIFRSIQQTFKQCSQTWYMIVDALTTLVSISILVLYCKKNLEQKKMQQFYSESLVSSAYQSLSHFNIPFIRMWILISTNIFCGIVNLIETAILYSAYNNTCQFSQNLNLNTLIHFIFLFFGYYVGAFVTLLVLNRIRIATIQSQSTLWHSLKQPPTYSHSYSIDIAESNKLELIAQMSSRSSSY